MVVRSAPGAPATSHAGARAETETRWEDASTSALTTDPWAQIDYIRSLLRDVYKDAGDGRTVVRELVQNADDAYASRLAFAILDAGWPHAENSLLRGPALVVVNDGPFREADAHAIRRTIGGSKRADFNKVGRFGLGLKSAFHLSESIVYVGAEDGAGRRGVLNPWAGTGVGSRDPLHPDWDRLSDTDTAALEELTRALIGDSRDYLTLWLPLRQEQHLDRTEGERDGLTTDVVNPDDVDSWFERPTTLALLLAQCRSAKRIEVSRLARPAAQPARLRIAWTAESHDGGLSRFVALQRGEAAEDEVTLIDLPPRIQSGVIERDGVAYWRISAHERCTWLPPALALFAGRDWPKDDDPPRKEGDRNRKVKRKALPHGAVTLIRPVDERAAVPAAIRLRWAVYFPLDDDPSPAGSDVVEELRAGPDHGSAWELLLHGYFWPSQDRRSIPGVTTDAPLDTAPTEERVRAEWNAHLRDFIVLPLVPGVLAPVLARMEPHAAEVVVGAIARSRAYRAARDSVIRDHQIVASVTPSGTMWSQIPAGTRWREIEGWSSAPPALRRSLWPALEGTGVVADGAFSYLATNPASWTSSEIQAFLGTATVSALDKLEHVRWYAGALRAMRSKLPEESHQGFDDDVAGWIALATARGLLPMSPRLSGTELDDARRAWNELMGVSRGRIVPVPVGAHAAVVELRKRSPTDGSSIILVPWKPDDSDEPRPDDSIERDGIVELLVRLGTWILQEPAAPVEVTGARIVAADALVSRLGIDVVLRHPRLSRLPLIAAKRLPADVDVTLTPTAMSTEMSARRLFARRFATDALGLARELAEAIAADVWVVNQRNVGAREVPLVTNVVALAAAVDGANGALAADPTKRLPLLERLLAAAGTATLTLRRLLHGQANDDNLPLYYSDAPEAEAADNRLALEGLLRADGREFALLPSSLADAVPRTRRDLNLRAANRQALIDLAARVTSRQASSDVLRADELLAVIRRTFSPHEQHRWNALAIHRTVDGSRAVISSSAVRRSSCSVPPELLDSVVVLEPEEEVAHLYAQVPQLDELQIARIALQASQPHRFFRLIVANLLGDAPPGRVLERRFESLRNAVATAAWIPHGGRGITPKQVLLVPSSWSAVGRELTGVGLGNHVPSTALPDDIREDLRALLRDLNHERIVTAGAEDLDLRLVDAIDVSAAAMQDLRISRTASWLTEERVRHAMDAKLSRSGWGLVAWAGGLQVEGATPSGASRAKELQLSIAHRLVGEISISGARVLLQALGGTTPAPNHAGRKLLCAYLEHFRHLPCAELLTTIALPTQTGGWQPAEHIARARTGLDPHYLPADDVASPLGIDASIRAPNTSEDVRPMGGVNVDRLQKYFASWRGAVREDAVGSMIALLGDAWTPSMRSVAEAWLGSPQKVDGVRQRLRAGRDGEPHPAAKVLVSVDDTLVKPGAKVTVTSLTGSKIQAPTAASAAIFASEPELRSSNLGPVWLIQLRDLSGMRLSSKERLDALGEAAMWWATNALRASPAAAADWWASVGETTQTEVQPIRTRVLDALVHTLWQLGAREHPALHAALQAVHEAIERRSFVQPGRARELQSAHEQVIERQRKFAELVERDDSVQEFLLSRVRAKMADNRYGPESLLVELAQNADDALAQLSEMRAAVRDELPAAACKLRVRLGAEAIELEHCGRPINEAGGSAFPGGKHRNWDQDLYFMLLMNLSSKPGEATQEQQADATTGRFGLGFKSVHLVSDRPRVTSGFLAFDIRAGLLPVALPIPEAPPSPPGLEGMRRTHFHLPYAKDVDRGEMGRRVMARFADACPIMPAVARRIRAIDVEDSRGVRTWEFEPIPVPDADGWTVSRDTVVLREEPDRLLRFRPGDVSSDSAATTAIVFVIGSDHRPRGLPPDFPNLWNVAPTAEAWDLGYVINGPFAVNPGRTHIDLAAPETKAVAASLGRALGERFIALHDALQEDEGAIALGITPSDAGAFLGRLWRVVARNRGRGDAKRAEFLNLLHGSENAGLIKWMRHRSVVPSGLRPPFSAFLPPLRTIDAVRQGAEHLEEPAVARFLDGHAGIRERLADIAVVSPEIAETLTRWWDIDEDPVTLTGIVREYVGALRQQISPEEALALEALAGGELSSHVEWRELGELRLVARDGGWHPVKQLLVPSEEEADEEALLSAFAPADAVLGGDYEPSSLSLVRRLRVVRELGARDAAAWIRALDTGRHMAVLVYLLRSKNHEAVLNALEERGRPPWLQNRAYVEQLTRWWDPLHRTAITFRLFPDVVARALNHASTAPAQTPEQAPVATLRREQVQALLNELYEEWREPHVRATRVGKWRRRWYGEERSDAQMARCLSSGDPEESHDTWMELFVLATAQMLGRTQPEQHHGFVRMLRHPPGDGRQTAWERLFGRDADAASWFSVLEDWANARVDRAGQYNHWWTILPELFACWRWLDDYRHIIVTLPRRATVGPHVLAPRVDPEQEMGGVDAPALPRVRVNWLMREVVRLGVIECTDAIAAECYPPSARLEKRLERLGMTGGPSSSRQTWVFLSELIGEERARFHNCFDLVFLDEGFLERVAAIDSDVAAELEDDDDAKYETAAELGTVVPAPATPPDPEAAP